MFNSISRSNSRFASNIRSREDSKFYQIDGEKLYLDLKQYFPNRPLL